MSRAHPPLFTALTNRLDPYHPVNALARAIAHREDDGRLLAEYDTLTRKHAPYYGRHYSDHHERDCT